MSSSRSRRSVLSQLSLLFWGLALILAATLGVMAWLAHSTVISRLPATPAAAPAKLK